MGVLYENTVMITTATATRPTAENLFQRNFWAEPSGAESHAGKAGVFARQGADPIEPHPAKVRGSSASMLSLFEVGSRFGA
jgi:hypothetical protein